MTDGQTDEARLRELAKSAAFHNHCENSHPESFDVCVHDDCVLVRRSVEGTSQPREPEHDHVCKHGTAMDVHCCNCHSGFIFDYRHECPDPAPPDVWVKVIHAIAVEAMTAQSDPNAEAQHYRKALIGICNMALKAQDVLVHPPAVEGTDAGASAAPNPPNIHDAAEMLWIVLANVSGGNWTLQSADWQEAAARWRDYYFSAITVHQPPVPLVVAPAKEPQE